jgi:hypothetical protein
MLKSYQRILIEAWINIFNLVTLDFSPGTPALLLGHLSSFQRLASVGSIAFLMQTTERMVDVPGVGKET